MIEECGNCRHYKPEEYCVLFDDFVKEADNCGMFDYGEES